MSKAPSMPLFVDAYMTDTLHLSEAEDGVYMRLLMCMWRWEGRLPDDDLRLARLARVTKARWVRTYRPVLEGFFKIADGFWQQKRLQKEWDHVSEKIDRNRQSGTMGGRPKNDPEKKPNGFATENRTVSKNDPEKKPNGFATENRTGVYPNPNPIPRKKERKKGRKGESHSLRETDFDRLQGDGECKPDANPDANPDATEPVCRPEPEPEPEPDGFGSQANPGGLPSLSADARTPATEPEPEPRRDDDAWTAFEAYNETATELGLTLAQAFTAPRQSKLKARLKECGGLEGWRHAMRRIRGSPFLCGGNDRGWKADLDFVLQQKSFTRLMEGFYDDRTGDKSRSELADTLAAIDEAMSQTGGVDAGGIFASRRERYGY